VQKLTTRRQQVDKSRFKLVRQPSLLAKVRKHLATRCASASACAASGLVS